MAFRKNFSALLALSGRYFRVVSTGIRTEENGTQALLRDTVDRVPGAAIVAAIAVALRVNKRRMEIQ